MDIGRKNGHAADRCAGGDRMTKTARARMTSCFAWLRLLALSLPLVSCAGVTTAAQIAAPIAADCARARAWITRSLPSGALQSSWTVPVCTAPAQPAVMITLQPWRRYQRIIGFGAALTGASAWLIERTQNTVERQRLLTTLFAPPPAGIGLSLLRVPIGSTDLSRRRYSLAPTAPAVAASAPRIDLTPITDTTLPVLKQVLSINPHLKIIASPWSAPAWMKTSGNLIGGQLKRSDERHFAQYLAGYTQAMRARGVPIYALTLQNEPDFTPGNYPGMKMGARQRARIIARYLGPMLARDGTGTAILDWDDNWSHPDQPLRVLANPAASRYVLGIAWHCYRGDDDAQTEVHDRFPDKLALLTECSDGEWAPDDRESLARFMNQVFVGPLRNWASGIVLWSLALDRAHGPHLGGCSKCIGIVTIRRADGVVTRTRDFYALAHFSRFIRTGAYRIGSSVTGAGIEAVAFLNPTRHIIAVIVTNRDVDAHWVQVDLSARRVAFEIPAGGAATVEIDTTHT